MVSVNVVGSKKRKEEVVPRVIKDEKGDQGLLTEANGNEFLLPASEVKLRQEKGALKNNEQTALAFDTQNQQKEQISRLEQRQSDTSGLTATQDLIQQQSAERQEKIRQMIDLNPQMGTGQRLQAAGFTTLNELAKFLTGGRFDAGEFTPTDGKGIGNKIVRGIETGVGFAVSRGIPTGPNSKISVGSILFPSSNNINELSGDSTELTSSVKSVYQDVANGGDINQAILTIDTLQQGVNRRYSDAFLELKQNPQLIADGIDLQEKQIKDLLFIEARKTMLQKYQSTGDPSELLAALQADAISETSPSQ